MAISAYNGYTPYNMFGGSNTRQIIGWKDSQPVYGASPAQDQMEAGAAEQAAKTNLTGGTIGLPGSYPTGSYGGTSSGSYTSSPAPANSQLQSALSSLQAYKPVQAPTLASGAGSTGGAPPAPSLQNPAAGASRTSLQTPALKNPAQSPQVGLQDPAILGQTPFSRAMMLNAPNLASTSAPAQVGGVSFTPGSTPGQVAWGNLDFTPADARAHQDAAFSRLKATSGQLGRNSVTSMRGELADRGILGSGVEARGLTDRLASTLQPLADLNVAQLQEEYDAAQRAQELALAQETAKYSGGINQRGQDIGLISSREGNALQAAMANMQGGISQRGQDMDFSQSNNALQAAMAQAQLGADVSQRGQDMDSQQALNALRAALATTQYQGGITQRGQDIGAQGDLNSILAALAQSQYSGDISQRGQDLSAGGDYNSLLAGLYGTQLNNTTDMRGQDLSVQSAYNNQLLNLYGTQVGAQKSDLDLQLQALRLLYG